jgi:DNA helicase HerA-like ATPase
MTDSGSFRDLPSPGADDRPDAPPYDPSVESVLGGLPSLDEAPADSVRVNLSGDPLVPAIEPVGFVDASIDATTRRAWLVLDDAADVALDEFVVAAQRLADGDVLFHYGIVVEAAGRVEGAESPTATRWINASTLPGVRARRVEIQWLRTLPERFLPPLSGAPVWRAAGEHRRRALYLDQMSEHERLPLGLDMSGQPVFCAFSFINGDKGGHVSISGKSGVATKTSYALFLLYLMFETAWGQRVRGRGAASDRALVFSVKGEDLLHLDRRNTDFAPGTVRGDEARAQWAALDVPDPTPFQHVTFYAPRAEGDDTGTHVANVRTRDRTAVTVYGWTPEAFIQQGLLAYAVDDGDAGQIPFIEQVVRLQLLRYAFPLAGDRTGKIVLADPDTQGIVVPRVWAKARRVTKPPLTPADGVVVSDFAELLEFIADKIVEGTPAFDPSWVGGVTPATVQAFVRRLWAAEPRLRPVVGAGLSPVGLGDTIAVVDIHSLHDAAQRFVVGALLARVWEDHEHGGHPGRTWVLLDELNKYGPRQGRSPIKDLLVDIAGRGRSLGVLLLGAQQSPSGVDPNITGNAALHVVGQIRAQEASELGFLPGELRERAQLVAPGTMITSQPLIPAPIPVRFPFPPYATRIAEVDTGDDIAEGDDLLEDM